MRRNCEERARLKVGYFFSRGKTFHAILDKSKNKFVKFGIGKTRFAREKMLDKFARKVADCFCGKKCRIDFRLLDFSGLTKFEKSVLLAVAKITRGETKTYGEIASEARRKWAARAVGSVMRKNPFPFVIPCHRVVRRDGIGEYGFGRKMKKELLMRERARV